MDRDSSWLRTGRSGDRILVGAIFSPPVQTGPGAQPASSTMGTGSLSREVKRPGLCINYPPLSSAEVKERVQLYLYSPLGLRGLFCLKEIHNLLDVMFKTKRKE